MCVQSDCVYLCGVEYVYDFAEDWAVLVFTLLADELDVSQLSKVEVPLFLQSVHSQLQVQQLGAETGGDKREGDMV